MNYLVMITKNEDGEVIPEGERTWCVLTDGCGSPMTLCTGEVFGGGEGNAEAELKTVKKGGITCENCIEIVKHIKAIRL